MGEVRGESVYVPLRLALTPSEAAQALDCSRNFFGEHIGPRHQTLRRALRRAKAVAPRKQFHLAGHTRARE